MIQTIAASRLRQFNLEKNRAFLASEKWPLQDNFSAFANKLDTNHGIICAGNTVFPKLQVTLGSTPIFLNLYLPPAGQLAVS